MSDVVTCPQCQSETSVGEQALAICAECLHEWQPQREVLEEKKVEPVTRDSSGHVLQTGDTVIVVKDIKLKGNHLVVPVGTKLNEIQLVAGEDELSCHIEGLGTMRLPSRFVKKV